MDEFAATWPTANLSEIMRRLLDRAIEKARHTAKAQIATDGEPNG